MQKLFLFFIFSSLGLLLTACETTSGVVKTKNNYLPPGVREIAALPHYPEHAAGFKRANTIAYGSGQNNVSTAYHLLTPEAKIIATVYEYPTDNQKGKRVSLQQQYLLEKQNIERHYATAKLLASESFAFHKNGKKYPAYRAKYKYAGDFIQGPQRLYSEMILVDAGNKFVKLRSTTSIIKRSIATQKNRQLMDVLHWAR